MDRWSGKIAVVTGASAGIGLATAKTLVQYGMTVVGLARRKEKMESEVTGVKGTKGKFYAFSCDVANDADVAKAFEWISQNVGKIQVLINNAGYVKPGKFTEIDNATLKNIIDVNLMGTVYCTKEALKVLQKDNLEGHIVNINSTAGHTVLKPMDMNVNIYIASKHAITGFCETLRRELMGQNIRVTSLSPGLVRSEMTQHPDIDPGILKQPALKTEDIANAIIYVLGTPQRVQVKELLIPPLGENFV